MTDQYLLLTAAKNEEQYIGKVIESVLCQSVLPVAWIIVDDGSNDSTADIVAGYAARHSFIKLHTIRSVESRSFGAKTRAINTAFGLASGLEFAFVGVHDADVAPVQIDYFARVLRAFEEDTALGISGGYIYECSRGKWKCRKANSPESVAGGVQLFRRECFEQVGGFMSLPYGGEDWLAQIEAEIGGWQVRALLDLPVHHFRPTSSANGRLRGLFRLGMMDASFGSHPVFEIFKCARRISERPLLLGSILRFAGYLSCLVAGRAPLLSAEKIAHLRQVQVRKIFDAVAFSTLLQRD